MEKNEYLSTLQRNLKNVPADEVSNIMAFYQEYFEDAGPENEAKVIAELGAPEMLAVKASANYVMNDIHNRDEENKNRKKSSVTNLWILILAICGSPIWFPLGIAVAIVAFALVIAIGSVIFAFGICCVALMLSGIAMSILGIGAVIGIMTVGSSTGLFAIGYGMVSVGLGILFFMATVQVFRGCKKLILFMARKRVGNHAKQNVE